MKTNDHEATFLETKDEKPALPLDKLGNRLPKGRRTNAQTGGVASVFRFSSLVLLFALALLLRLYRLDDQSLWLDELNTWWLVVNASWGALWSDLWRSESAYPLFHVLLKVWIAVAGDSEWALRLPSALAGAGAVVAVALAAEELFGRQGDRETGRQGDQVSSSRVSCLVSALILAFSPFALWYAQEVKTYSLLLCASALTVWLFLRALRRNDWRGWLAFGGVALLSVFVHRFALLLLLGCLAGWISWQLVVGRRQAAVGRRRIWRLVIASCFLLIGSVLVVWQMTQGLGEEGAATGEHIAAGPIQAIWITLWRFVLDRGPWEAPWWWLLPGAVLAVWGGFELLRAALRGDRRILALLCCGFMPLALFLSQLWWTRLYEPRYLMIVYPVWVLALGYPFRMTDPSTSSGQARRPTTDDSEIWRSISQASRITYHVSRFTSYLLLAGVLLGSIAALLQPQKGLWSGDPVKEQYREAIRYLVDRAHPDDAVVLHPEYLRTAWDYYAPRDTTGPLPQAVAFDAFKKYQHYFSQRDWDASRDRALNGHFRSLLLIAPAHARTVDPTDPKFPDDEYGLVGLYYQYSWKQNKWPCGGARFNGVHVLCQASPEAYVTGAVAEPQVPLQAQFGDSILFKGYTLPVATVRAGSVLPITLYWDVRRQPSEDYFVFLHLCQDCNQPPAASDDGPPLGGGVPTSIWKPNNPVHDERTVIVPRDLAPGRYTLLLGLYRPGDATTSARLPIRGGDLLGDNRLIIGTIDVTTP